MSEENQVQQDELEQAPAAEQVVESAADEQPVAALSEEDELAELERQIAALEAAEAPAAAPEDEVVDPVEEDEQPEAPVDEPVETPAAEQELPPATEVVEDPAPVDDGADEHGDVVDTDNGVTDSESEAVEITSADQSNLGDVLGLDLNDIQGVELPLSDLTNVGNLPDANIPQTEPVPEADTSAEQPARGQTPFVTHVDEVPFFAEPVPVEQPELVPGDAIAVTEDPAPVVIEEASAELALPTAEPDVVTIQGEGVVLATVGEVVDQAPVAEQQPAGEVTFDKPIDTWTLDDVRAVIAGELQRPHNVTERQVVERGRFFTYQVDPHHANWSFREVFLWLKTGELPTVTSGGHYLQDPVRLAKKANEWTSEELVDFLKGELQATLEAPEEELMDTVQVMWRLPNEWSDDETTDYVLYNRQPQKSASGFWVNDRVRMRKPAKYWSIAELMAFVRDEIPATQVASEEQLYSEIRARFGVSESYSQERLYQLLAEYKEEPLSMPLQFVQHNLDRYQSGMGKGVMVTEEGAAGFQTLMNATIGRVMRLDGRDFVDGWTMILDFIHANRAYMFIEQNAYRGINKVMLSSRERENFEQLLNLVIKTSNPATRYAQAQNTNFAVALGGITNEAIRQRVMGYYNVGV